jgi:hypothetical protein
MSDLVDASVQALRSIWFPEYSAFAFLFHFQSNSKSVDIAIVMVPGVLNGFQSYYFCTIKFHVW